jgi:hypothetical protein
MHGNLQLVDGLFIADCDNHDPGGENESMGPVKRLVTYTLAGYAGEVVISAVHDLWRKKPVRFRTSPLMLPVYSTLLPLYEPLHETVRERSLATRAIAYGVGFLTVEYASGIVFRKTVGEAPWDYSDARYHLHGLVRADYFFQWALMGLALEPLHDALTSE